MTLVVRPDDLTVVTCCSCGMHYVAECPDESQLAAFYRAYSSTHQNRSTDDPARLVRSAQRNWGLNALLAELARLRKVSAARLLEVGCSTGSLLLQAQCMGAVVHGIELDDRARVFVSDRLGIPCYASLSDAAEVGPFDIVVAMNLIEHLVSPDLWLAQVHGLLSPGGILVLWLPNGGQLDVLGAGWVGLRVDLDHFNYFSARTLAALLTCSGFWPEAVWEFKQASLGGFLGIHGVRFGLFGRLSRRLASWRSGVLEPALPGGSYTLCMMAGRGPDGEQLRKRPDALGAPAPKAA